MGKRQTRIFQPGIVKAIPSLSGKELQLVLKNGKTIQGKILSFDHSLMKVQDAFMKVHPLDASQIEEIIIDKVAEY